MIIKILLLVSSINSGDIANAKTISNGLNAQEVFIVDSNKPLEELAIDYKNILLEKCNNQEKYLTLAVGEKSMKALKFLAHKNILDSRANNYTALILHQYFTDLSFLAENHIVDHLIVPLAAQGNSAQKIIIDKFPHTTLTFAVPGINLSTETLVKAYHDWHYPTKKPSLQQKSIIVILPGDAPDAEGNIRNFTQESAKELAENVYNLWKNQGKKHQILIHNGPRTGKHYPLGSHSFNKGEGSTETVIDPISKLFKELLEEKNIPCILYNFAFEIDGENKNLISVYKPLLYLAKQNDNILIAPGESISTMGDVTSLNMPANRVIIFKPSSMNEEHNALLEYAFSRGFISYFDHLDIRTPKNAHIRTESDGEKVVKALDQAFNHSINK